ncbi:MAG: nuclear transport factor 2 family protein [Chloroflexi bacterium]|nr:nuclear transport factor 2 family protein [Chloroflexota bacterium]
MDKNLTVQPLTPQLVSELWSQTYNTQGKPDWSHIFPYYHKDIIFEDSIQHVEGIADFKALCQRLTNRSQKLTMQITTVVGDTQHIFLEWIMTITYKKNPDSSIYGTTHLTLTSEGYIIRQRDYYDLWGDIFNAIPWFHKPYRRFMRKHFG